MSQQALFAPIEKTSSPALSRVVQQLQPNTYELFSFNTSIEIAFFNNEQLAYVVNQEGELMLVDNVTSARSALDRWIEESLPAQEQPESAHSQHTQTHT